MGQWPLRPHCGKRTTRNETWKKSQAKLRKSIMWILAIPFLICFLMHLSVPAGYSKREMTAITSHGVLTGPSPLRNFWMRMLFSEKKDYAKALRVLVERESLHATHTVWELLCVTVTLNLVSCWPRQPNFYGHHTCIPAKHFHPQSLPTVSFLVKMSIVFSEYYEN